MLKALPRAKFYFKVGNHEERLRSYLKMRAPELFGLPYFDFSEFLQLRSKDIELIRLLGASQCIECGSCTYVCPSNIAVTEGIRQAKTLLALHPLKKPEEKGGKK